MEEQASFETCAVLAPKRARRTRLAILVPAVALVGIAVAGLGGTRGDQPVAEVPARASAIDLPPTTPAPSVAAIVPRTPPSEVLGLAVHRLDEVQPQGNGQDDLVVLAGWYATTSITDCPKIAAIYKDGALPYIRGDADELAFCARHGVLYATSPLPFDGRNRKPGLQSVEADLAVGIIVPRAIEVIGAAATEVVIIGRFVANGDACLQYRTACPARLVVDHVAWTAGA